MPIDFETRNEEIIAWNDDASKELESDLIGEMEQAAAADLESRLETYARAHGIEV